MKRNLSLILALILTAALVLGGCSSNGNNGSGGTGTPDNSGGGTGAPSSQPVEVVVWHTFSDHQLEAFQAIVDDYNASQSEVKVVSQTQAWDDFDEKLMQAVRNGTGPDIALDYAATVANYLSDGFVTNLTPYITDPEIGIEGFQEKVAPGIYREATQFDEAGSIYIMPVVTTGTVFYYNKTMYDELGLSAPATWDELVSNCEKIKAEKGAMGFGFDNLVDGAQILLMQSGIQYYDKSSNTVDINAPAAVETYDWFAQQISAGLFKLQPDGYFESEFAAGDIAGYVTSVASAPYVEDAVAGNFEIGVAAIPQGDTAWAPAWNRGAIVFNSDEATQRAAYLFLKYFTGEEVNAQWCVDFGALSAYPAVNESAKMQELLADDAALTALSAGLEDVGYIPAFNGSNTVREEISKALQETATGLKTAQQALQDSADICNAELAGK